MSKAEFLDVLRMQLQDTLSQAEIEGHLHYYNEYITDAVASGKTEEQVTEELGSPVFIAKTLMDTAEAGEQAESFVRGERWSREEQWNGDGRFGRNDSGYGYDDSSQEENGYRKTHVWHISPFVAKYVIPVVVILLLVLLVFLLSTLVGAAIAIVARLFIPIMLVILVFAIFKSHK